MKKKTLFIVLGIAVIATLVIVKLMANKRTIESHKVMVDRSHIPVSVNTEKVKMMKMSAIISRPAVISPNEQANITAEMPGRIESLNIELGTKVTKGQVIGKIDTKTYDVQLQNIQLAATKYATDFKRNKELYEGKALSESQYLDSKYAMEAKKLEAEQLQQQIAQSNIKSPISGIITDKQHLSGEFIGGGTPVAVVQDVNTLKIDAFVNESEVRFVHVGDEATIFSAIFPNKLFKGKVTYVSPSADNNFNYKVEVKVNTKNNPDLKAGAYITVSFNATIQDEMALQIPKRALAEGVKDAYVYVKKGDRAEKRIVRVGRENGAYIEIVDGLKEGEEVVTDGQVNIVDKSLIQSK